MSRVRVTFKERLGAWWSGTEIANPDGEELQRIRHKQQVGPSRPDEKRTPTPLADWQTARVQIIQSIWGTGFDKPGGTSRVLGLVKPFGLDPAKSVMEFGTGLGGAARTISQEYGVWVTGYEADAELSHAGKQLSVIAGLDRKADIQLYDVENVDLAPNKYDCILSSETLHAFASKYDILLALQKSLKARGQLSMTDFALGEGIAPSDDRLKVMLTGSTDLWQPGQYERRMGDVNLDLRVTEDISDQYRKMIMEGWTNFAKGDAATSEIAKAHPSVVIAELDLWSRRIKAIEQGLLRVVRIYAIKKNGPKLMSDW